MSSARTQPASRDEWCRLAVLIKRIPMLGAGVAYIGGGSLTRLGELEDIQRSLSERWLRRLKKSEKVRFELEIGTDPVLLDRFRVLLETSFEWKDFQLGHGPRSHSNVRSTLPEETRYRILLWHHEGELAYGLVLAVTGDTAVHVLKAGMTVLGITAPGPFECVPDQARGLLVAVAERGYKGSQELKRRRSHFRRR